MVSSRPPDPNPPGRTSSGKRTLEGGSVNMYSNSKRAKVADPLTRKAKHYGRVVEPFINVTAIAQWGLMRGNSEHSITEFLGVEEMSEEDCVWNQKRLDFCYDKLLELAKELKLEKGLRDSDQCMDIAKQIEYARGLGRSDDTQGCKKAVIDWLGTDIQGPTLSRRTKDKRGFSHPHIGQLLAPADVDWGDPEQRRSLVTGKRLPKPEESPHLFWKDGQFNPKRFWDGFLRHELAVKAFKHIFTSPSSAVERSDGSSGRSTKKGNAAINDMTAVTLDSIAYVHLHLHHALSDVETFNRDDQRFSYLRFYNHLIRFLYEQYSSDDGQRQIKALLAWWDRRIFPVHHFEPPSQDRPANSLAAILAASVNQGTDDEGQSATEGELGDGVNENGGAGAGAQKALGLAVPSKPLATSSSLHS